MAPAVVPGSGPRTFAIAAASEEEQEAGKAAPLCVERTGDVREERWEFDFDSYTVGMLAVMQQGPVRAMPLLLFSCLAPVIQMTTFFFLIKDLFGERHIDPDFRCNAVVWWICFVLSCSQCSNEMLESFRKLVFSLRAFSGFYVRARGSFECIVLALMQFFFASTTCGLCLLVVSKQTTTIDAFLNYVALGFIAEIDNTLLASNMVRALLPGTSEFTVQLKSGLTLPSSAKAPWSVQMMLNSVAMAAMLGTVGAFVLSMSAATFEPPPHLDWLRMAPQALVALLAALNATWIGSLLVGAPNAGCAVSVLMMVCFIADSVLMYHTGARVLTPLTSLVCCLFAPVSFASTVAVVHDPFQMLLCPYRTPLVLCLVMASVVVITDTIHRFGVPGALP